MSFMLFVGAAGANNAGYLTTGTQTIAGAKTFTSRVKMLPTADAALEFGAATDRGFLSASATGSLVGFGVYHDGTNFIARKTSAGAVLITPTSLVVYMDSGLTVGSSYTPTQVFKADATGTAIGAGAVGGRLTIPAGTATAGTSPAKFTSGTLLTSPEALALECNGTKLYWTPSATREQLYSGLALVAASLAPGTINANTVWESGDIAVSTAAANDPVLVGAPPTIEAGILWCAFVSSTGNVRVRLANPTAGNIAVATQTWNVTAVH